MAKPEFKQSAECSLDFTYTDAEWDLSLKFLEYKSGSSHNTAIYQVVLSQGGSTLKSERVAGQVAAKKTGKAWIDLARTRCL